MNPANTMNPAMSDADLFSAFEDATLPPDQFHHAQHVRVAFLYLQKYEALEAIARFSAALIALPWRSENPTSITRRSPGPISS